MGLLDALSRLLGGGDDTDGGPGEPSGADSDDGTGSATSSVEGDGPDDVADYGPGHFAAEAEEFAKRHDDLPLAFGVESLEALDEYAAGQGEIVDVLDAEMEDDGFLAELHGGYTLWLGSYFGEVLVRQFDGQWRRNDGWAVAVPVDGGALEVSVFDVAAASVADEPCFAETAAALEDGIESAAAGESRETDAEPHDAETPFGTETPFAAEARELSEYWSEYNLDGSPESLARLDELVDAQWENERFRDAELGGEPLDDRVFAGLVRQLGSYYGEVLVGHLGGEWIEHETLGTAVEVEGDDGAAAVANVFHVAADCLTEPSKFALSFDTVADHLDLGRERISEGGQVVTADADEWAGDDLIGGEEDAEEDVACEEVPEEDVACERASTAGDDESVPGDEALRSDDIAAGFREEAEDLVEQWPGYDLDYSPGSLERLDRLVAEEFAEFDFSDVDLGREGDGDSLFLTARAMEAGGYLAEVLRRTLGGEWRDEDGIGFVVAGREGEARLDPVAVAAAVFRGEDSFAATYEAVRGRLSVPERDGARDPATEPDEAGDPATGPDESPDPPPEPDGEPDPVIDRLSAKAAIDAAGEDLASEPAVDVGDRYREAAEDLAGDWPAYDLDYSVESLVRLDALVADEFDHSDGDRDYDGDPLSVPEGTTLSIPTDGSVEGFTGYLAAVLGRHHGAEWRRTGDGDVVLVVEGETATAELKPVMVAIACFAGESSFVDAYASVAADVGLEPPVDG